MRAWFVFIMLPFFVIGFTWEWAKASFLVGRECFKLAWEMYE